MNATLSLATESSLPLENQILFAGRPVRLLDNDSLMNSRSTDTDWLWHGYLARGAITLLISRWKLGKTTLLSALMRKLAMSDEFAGRRLAPAKVLVVSEESESIWRKRAQKCPFPPNVRILCRPFVIHPSFEQWQEMVTSLVELHERERYDLFVIDTLVQFLPSDSENCASRIAKSLSELHRLTSAGAAVLLNHHPRKKPGAIGFASRGSGVLTSMVDLILEMEYGGVPSPSERKRILYGLSRFEETPASWVVELAENGLDYISHGAGDEINFQDGWSVLQMILRTRNSKLTITDIVNEWPIESGRPCAKSISNWLGKAVQEKIVLVEGIGVRSSPYKYFLASRAEEMNLEPLEWLAKYGQAAAEDTMQQFVKILGKHGPSFCQLDPVEQMLNADDH